nr:tyrosine--tRNA ligase [Pelagibacteraceae bacterium]
MKFKSDFLKEIQSRGFIYQSSDIEQLDDLINKKKITAYIGFDITSDSLHIGSLVQLMLLHWLDFYDHKTIALVGGGTTLVGDPSGKDDTRKIMTLDQINQNIIKIEKIFGQFINLNKNGSVINNYDWLSELNYINFLRDVGSKLTLNKMLTYESVKNRLEREQPLTFLEFNYMLLQSYDFYYLKKNYNCLLQMGGSDQWGNIINGIDLIRKMLNEKAYALTSPLITNTDGSKMGKTAKGAIWLNKEKLSNFEFYQFWRNINDEDIERFLMLFTNINLNEIQKLSQLKGQEINEAKKILAYEVTKITRGITSANEAKDIANNIFNKKKIDERILTFEIESIELQK